MSEVEGNLCRLRQTANWQLLCHTAPNESFCLIRAIAALQGSFGTESNVHSTYRQRILRDPMFGTVRQV